MRRVAAEKFGKTIRSNSTFDREGGMNMSNLLACMGNEKLNERSEVAERFAFCTSAEVCHVSLSL
jgi:hypothetical protein